MQLHPQRPRSYHHGGELCLTENSDERVWDHLEYDDVDEDNYNYDGVDNNDIEDNDVENNDYDDDGVDDYDSDSEDNEDDNAFYCNDESDTCIPHGTLSSSTKRPGLLLKQRGMFRLELETIDEVSIKKIEKCVREK